MTKLEFRSFRGPGEQSRGRRGPYGQETRTDGYTKHQIREAGALDNCTDEVERWNGNAAELMTVNGSAMHHTRMGASPGPDISLRCEKGPVRRGKCVTGCQGKGRR